MAARMTRMQLILRKALDVSVSQASTVGLRAAFEAECRDDPQLLAQFFGMPDDDEEQKVEDADELSAQILLSLRQKIEVLSGFALRLYPRVQTGERSLNEMQTAFEDLCAKYDINANLMELERLIRDAERQQEEPVEKETSPSNDQKAAAKTPDEIVCAEICRVMGDEKAELQELLQQECAEVERLRAAIDALRRNALQDAENVHAVVANIDSTLPSTVDYSSHT